MIKQENKNKNGKKEKGKNKNEDKKNEKTKNIQETNSRLQYPLYPCAVEDLAVDMQLADIRFPKLQSHCPPLQVWGLAYYIWNIELFVCDEVQSLCLFWSAVK